jgi:hypothetical protein
MSTGLAANPTIKPNLSSLRAQNILNQWNTSRTLKTYQNFSASADTRMARNDDWGAAAYLASSIYGAGVTSSSYGVVQINGNASVTGCGPTASGSGYTYYAGVNCTPTSDNIDRSYYTTLGRLASTTNNPTGIYDVNSNGDAAQYTLSNYAGTVSGSGLTANGSGGFTQIDDKYINFYPSSVFGTYFDVRRCTVATCAGQALFETDGWNGSSVWVVIESSVIPWHVRGALGLFSSTLYTGDDQRDLFNSTVGWRAVQSKF